MNNLERARQLINETDKEMAKLFEKRMDAVKLVAAYKKENGIPVDDFGREDEIIKKNCTLIENEDYRSYYINFLKETISLSKKMQHKLLDGMTVAYSGVEGAFANIAAQKVFPDAICVPHANFKSAYNAVVNGECDCALLPLENSHNGDVAKVLDLAFFGDLYVNGMYEIEIIQNLLALPGVSLKDIKKVSSELTEEIQKEVVEPLNEAVKPLKEAVEPITDVAKDLKKTTNDLKKSVNSIGKDEPKKTAKAEEKEEEKTEEKVEEKIVEAVVVKEETVETTQEG